TTTEPSMRIRWRNFELPSKVVPDKDTLTNEYGRFVVEPFEQGFGNTIGNGRRRVLLSSIEGTAVNAVRIAGANHEFDSLEGILEDVTDIILNVKRLRFQYDGEGPERRRGRGLPRRLQGGQSRHHARDRHQRSRVLHGARSAPRPRLRAGR